MIIFMVLLYSLIRPNLSQAILLKIEKRITAILFYLLYQNLHKIQMVFFQGTTICIATSRRILQPKEPDIRSNR